MELYLREDIKAFWGDDDPFTKAQQQQGEIFRNKEGRRTLRFEVNGKSYFLKLHEGIGWGEIIKNLIQLRLPVLGASNEKLAIEHLEHLGIDTMKVAAYGNKGGNPAVQLSFLVTDDLIDTISLEDYCDGWASKPPAFQEKKTLLERLAKISKKMHDSGMNHRDYYLCHFLIPNDEAVSLNDKPLYLIDLHRAQLRGLVPIRWKVKDIGSLYYSALSIGLTRSDVLRFVRFYSGEPLRETLAKDKRFWSNVRSRAETIYKRDFGELPDFPL